MMTLYISPTSPYARKCAIVRLEKGLADQIDVREASAMKGDMFALTGNPLAKVPTLVRTDGSLLYDSPVICAYLDSLAPDPTLIPSNGEERWCVERSHALADGILDAAFSHVMERQRPDADPSIFWLERWQRAIDRGLTAIAEDLEGGFGTFDMGRIAYASVLGYMDLRFNDRLDWRRRHPVLKDWFDSIAKRDSMIRTAPPAV